MNKMLFLSLLLTLISAYALDDNEALTRATKAERKADDALKKASEAKKITDEIVKESGGISITPLLSKEPGAKKDLEQIKTQGVELSLNQQIEEEFCSGIFTRADQLTKLSIKSLSCILDKYEEYTLKLNKVMSIDIDFVSYIKDGSLFYLRNKLTGKTWYFNGFTYLSPEVRDLLLSLAAYSSELHLDGLKIISRNDAHIFHDKLRSSFNLSLSGLKSVSVEEGIYLSDMPNLIVSDEIRNKLNDIKQGNQRGKAQ